LASLATGEVLFFVDADVEIPPGFVELALPILENLRDRQIWAPQILPAQALNGPSRFFSRFVLSPKKVETFTIIPSTAFAVRRSAWAVLGGFSELFLEAGGEDWEWIIRNHLHTPGFYVTYDPAFSVLHDNPVSLRELWTRASKYGSAAPLLEAHFAPIDRARFFPPRRGSYVHRFAGSFSALVNLLALRNPRSTGAQVVQWGGRLLTSWDRRDFVSSVFFLLVISLAYRTARHKNLRYLPLSDSEMRQTG
jgi:GT2 family glycosyltransferase